MAPLRQYVCSVQVLIEMDHKDEISGRLHEIHERLQSAYCQFRSKSLNLHEDAEKSSGELVLESPEKGNGASTTLEILEGTTNVTTSSSSSQAGFLNNVYFIFSPLNTADRDTFISLP